MVQLNVLDSSQRHARVIHVVHDLRASELPEPQCMPDYAYGSCPPKVLEAALLASSNPSSDLDDSPYKYAEVWSSILNSEFSGAYLTQEDWRIPHTSAGEEQPATLAVIPQGENHPVAVILLFPGHGGNQWMRDAATYEAKRVFDQTAPYCACPKLAVIAAMGLSWSAVVGSPSTTTREMDGIFSHLGPQQDWAESVVSSRGWELLQKTFAEVYVESRF
ncbi:hypothetical protein CYLTODRAFT_487472 [Cylindrobasidium torrendii FP15055 ss-10]|uniref:Uncharacterized protein n=1 Tax=Cylindrobasidium torrendii FP15055 ss-10 TaxID=1314674 RepID=A0A0D7BLK4_9AGAR|nr:hypothetical protein CYLTODRAFT_487472 [Cylindrobasidium torrendii FP15055 ss-10]